MSRSLALFGIGLVFGGGIGFLVAAGNGITLDGHDHSDPQVHGGSTHGDAHGAMNMAGAHASHDVIISLPDAVDAPSLDVAITPDPVSGWNLHLLVQNFRFAPEHASSPHIPGEGHAHVYVNGTKIARLYGPWLHIPDLPAGDNEVTVTLTANDHSQLAVGDKPLRQTMTVSVAP